MQKEKLQEQEEHSEKVRQKIQKPKTVLEILNEQLELGMKEHRRSNTGLLFSGFSAGLEVGFSVFLMGILHSMYYDVLSPGNLHVLVSMAYPIGFILVIIGRSELFTEHTTLAVLPVLNGSVSVKSLAVLWGIVYIGNLAGGYVFAGLMGSFTPAMQTINGFTFDYFANKLISYDWQIILGSGIGAGWLMGLLSWLVSSSQETISRIFIIIIITSLIGLGGLHHSIVGSIEVFTGMIYNNNITFSDYLHFQIWATLGNAIGGVFFVAIIKYSHTKRSE
ncbi:MAG: formate/nitrite transporter family protein [Candidatus Cyclobacteriaceae bacterium M3_2C_046]